MLRRLQKFPEDHPLLMKLVGAGLCVAGAGAGAVSVPGLLAALGIKWAILNGAAGVVGAAGVTGAVTQGAAVAGAVTAGAKLFLSTLAVDVGTKLMETEVPTSPVRVPSTARRLLGLKPSRANATADIPLS